MPRLFCGHAGCSRVCLTADALKAHQRTHEGLLPFVCPHPRCGRTFAIRGNMRTHLLTHQAVRSVISCPVPGCDKTFKKRQTLVSHVRTKHQTESASSCSSSSSSSSSMSPPYRPAPSPAAAAASIAPSPSPLSLAPYPVVSSVNSVGWLATTHSGAAAISPTTIQTPFLLPSPTAPSSDTRREAEVLRILTERPPAANRATETTSRVPFRISDLLN